MKSICICLPEYPDAIEKAKAHFAESGLDDLEFFWGINAPVAGLATSHVYEVDNPASGFRMGSKPTGIWLSHYMLWNCLTRLPDDHFLILETDAKFQPDWKERLVKALKDVPTNYDFLHIGHCCLEGHQRELVAGEVYQTKQAQCTHAYIMARKCIPFLLRRLRKIWAPIDCQMIFECFPHLNTYAVMPRLVDQFDTVLNP